MAEYEVSCGSEKDVDELMEDAHDAFKKLYGKGKSTKEMSVSEMHTYYSECQKHSIEMLGGVSGMDEDLKEFDHGFTKSE
jgi:soluble cytochrome b562